MSDRAFGEIKMAVVATFPEAYAWDTGRGGFDIIDVRDKDTAMSVGYGKTEFEAWSDAYSRQTRFPASDPVPVEAVVLPDLIVTEQDVARANEYCDKFHQGAGRSIASIKAKEFCRERQLTEAITQRDAARKDVALLAHNHPFGGLYHALTEAQAEREKACNAVMTMQLKLGTAEVALAAMTEDRNLWQNAHDEDCPNKAALAEEKEIEMNQKIVELANVMPTDHQCKMANKWWDGVNIDPVYAAKAWYARSLALESYITPFLQAFELLTELSLSQEFLLHIDPDSHYGRRVTVWRRNNVPVPILNVRGAQIK